MKSKISLTAISVVAVLLSLDCSHPTQTTGNGSGAGNAVVGILYQPDGITPAAGVRVHIRPKTSLADTTGAGLPKTLTKLAATDSVVTDSAGRYAFDTTIDTGTYVITSASGNNAVLIDSVALKNKAVTDSLAPDTLKPAGALKGVIKLSEGGDPRKVFVLAFGIDRFARVNIDGSFKFSGLAEAAYDLRLISSLDNYGVLDTVGVPVRSADTTNLDTISLPFTGIPTPKNVKISYDTLKQIVTLTWSKADTALVKSYNVYRRNVDSNTVLARINTSPVVDTVYRDSTATDNQTYEYNIVAVGKGNVEGTASTAAAVIVASPFKTVRDFTLSNTAWRITLKNNPGKRIYCYGTGDSVIIYDSIGTRKGAFRVFPTADDIAADGQDNLYSVYWGDTVVNKWTPNDSLTSTWKFREFYQIGYTSSPQPRLKILDTSVICIYDERQVVTYTTSGIFINQFTLPTGQLFAAARSRDSLLVYDSLAQALKWYNRNWQPSGVIPLQSMPAGNTVKNAEVYNDTLIVLQSTNLQNESSLLFVNPLKATLIARLKANATDFGIGSDGRVYALIAGNNIAIYERQGW